MELTDRDLDFIVDVLKPIRGLKSWRVSLGYGTFITLDFGEQLVHPEGTIRGEYVLWIYDCAWRVETDKTILVGSGDSRDKMAAQVKNLENKTLINITLSRPGLETIFEFETGLFLRVFPYNTEDIPHWMFLNANGYALKIGPGSDWACMKGDEA